MIGVLWVGPGALGRDLVVQVDLREPRCVERVSLRLVRAGERVAGLTEAVGDGAAVRWQARLPSDRYRLYGVLECADGVDRLAFERPVDLEADVEVRWTVTATCGCAEE